MNKPELIARVAEHHSTLDKADVEAVVDTIFGRIADALTADDRAELRGFGVFSAVSRPPRPTRNPRSGETVLVGKKRIVAFKASRTVKAQLHRAAMLIDRRTERSVVKLDLLSPCGRDRPSARQALERRMPTEVIESVQRAPLAASAGR